MCIMKLCAVSNTNLNTYERNVFPLKLYGQKRDILHSCQKNKQRQSALQKLFSLKGEAGELYG